MTVDCAIEIKPLAGITSSVPERGTRLQVSTAGGLRSVDEHWLSVASDDVDCDLWNGAHQVRVDIARSHRVR